MTGANGPDGGRHPLFMPVILVGGLLFGFGLAASQMARPEVVLDFLQLTDLGLLFVMFGAAVVSGLAFAVLPRLRERAPLTGDTYGRRLKSFDRNVLVGGAIFGVGWGISGVCPGSAYASVGIGNWPILIAIAGMFIGAYLQGVWRSRTN
ncbi:YeeE/YedE family protein [Halorhabdus sp. SVX81]|uniref:YeeE/YedE family protein n=1 Tax=Halorhabdus sp. SVX81 TaxID=2978283 RepID=UPI0023DA7407|nr:YeeE/YedE family protein [Halorhabdus sp. SVX81]